MAEDFTHTIMETISDRLDKLTPKSRILGNYIMQNPRKAVFMTTKELAETCAVSEATVVRFVGHIGYDGYGEFLQALRDFVDSDMSLSDRLSLPSEQAYDLLHRVILEEINNLKHLNEIMDRDALKRFAEHLAGPNAVYVVGSRLSYTFAYYLGWSLTKIRRGVRVLKGSDSTSIDWLVNAPDESIVVIIATSRYPNELIKLGKFVRRLNHSLLLVADSTLCPLIQFAHESLVVPSKYIPLVSNPASISCIISYLIREIADKKDSTMRDHQNNLEQVYRESDLLFSLYNDYYKPSQNKRSNMIENPN